MKRKLKWRNADTFTMPNPLASMGDARGYDRDTLAVDLGVGSSSAIRFNLAPLDHPDYRVPRPALMQAIFEWSDGILTPDHFYPVKLWRDVVAERAMSEGEGDTKARARGDIEALS